MGILTAVDTIVARPASEAIRDDDGVSGLPPEIAFLAGHPIPLACLRTAAETAARTGVTAETVLLADGVISGDRYYRALAEHLGLPYAERAIRPAASVVLGDVLRTGLVELVGNPQGWRYLAAPRGPALIAFLRFMGRNPRDRPPLAMTAPDRLEAVVRHHCRRSVVRTASHGLHDWDATLSARRGLNARQSVALGALTATSLWAGFAAPGALGVALAIMFFIAFMLAVLVRLIATAASSDASEVRTPPPVPDGALPVYSVIVPLFREARVVRRLVESLNKLDYPRSKLDILLMVEANDPATLDAIESMTLPARYRTVVAPPGRPQTKPRALNIALQFARGDCVVIYDAEDEPEPRQLRDAAARFAADPDVACLQARLAIDNLEDNWLTRLFAMEYAALFHVINPGLAALRLPIALGGTSNHFRIEALRHVSGWDAWNVTEDIDLGIRLARFGLRVGSLASTTFEEAPNTLKAWLAQRSRWQKGWMVTLGTHSRHPLRLWRDLRTAQTIAVGAMLFGTVASCLLGPFFFVVLLLRLWSGDLLSPQTPAATAWSISSGILVTLGVVSAVWPILAGLRRRKLMRLASELWLLPVYLLLLSIAAWEAAIEVFGRPYAWTKTEHGRAKRRLGSFLPG